MVELVGVVLGCCGSVRLDNGALRYNMSNQCEFLTCCSIFVSSVTLMYGQ